MPSIRSQPLIIFAISVSIFGLLLIILFALNPPMPRENFSWRKPLVGTVFSLICIFGIIAAIFPKQCSHTFDFRKASPNSSSHQISIKAHHPDCEEFSTHVIYVGNRTFCAACTGLLLGAVIALGGTMFYFFGGWHIEMVSSLTVLIGIVATILGFFQLKFSGYTRFMLNTCFVLGAFLILVGIDGLAESLFVDLFLLALIFFWIFTRIELSRWDHWRICSNCKSPCEVR